MRLFHTAIAALCGLALAGCGSEFSGTGGGGGGGSAGGTATGGTGQGGTGGDPGTGAGSTDIGCSDGEREQYLDHDFEPDIAACAGGFELKGVINQVSQQPQCSRDAGDDSSNPGGMDCSVEDLCSPGWHVCASADEVRTHAAGGQCPTPQPTGTFFWLTRQSQDQDGNCSSGGENNLVGCGENISGQAPPSNCAPLNTELRYTDCEQLAAWDCGGGSHASAEATMVFKINANEGGVLCCRN